MNKEQGNTQRMKVVHWKLTLVAMVMVLPLVRCSLVFSTRADDPLRSYILEHSLRRTDIQRDLSEESQRVLGVPPTIQPEEIQLVQLMVSLVQARYVIDIGVDSGLVSLGMAYNLQPDGQIIALTKYLTTAGIAKQYWHKAGFGDTIDLRWVNPQQELSRMLEVGESEKYDLIFIDGTNAAYADLYELVLKLVRKGGVIIIDNVLLNGDVVGTIPGRQSYVVDQLNDRLHSDLRVELVMLPIGNGLTMLRKV